MAKILMIDDDPDIVPVEILVAVPSLGAFEGVELFKAFNQYIRRGIVTTVVQIHGTPGVPAARFGGPFIRDMAQMNRRIRFGIGVGKGSYPRGMLIEFLSFEEYNTNERAASSFSVTSPYVDRLMDVGKPGQSISDTLTVVGAIFNPSNGKVIDSTAKTTSMRGRIVSTGLNRIPQAGVIAITGEFSTGYAGTSTCYMDYSFVPTPNKRRGEVEERIFSLQLDDAAGKKRQVGLVHIRATLRRRSPTCSIQSMIFGTSRSVLDHNLFVNSHSGEQRL